MRPFLLSNNDWNCHNIVTMRRLACESGGKEERNLITSDGYIPNQITHGTGWKWHPAVVLARESNLLVALIKKKLKLNMSFFQMHPILLNLAATWTGNRPLRWTDVITAAYYCRIYILFLACECCYANGMCALWTAGFRWLISATHLQSAFVWGPTAWWQRCFFQICSNWSKNNAPGMLFGNVHILGMS